MGEVACFSCTPCLHTPLDCINTSISHCCDARHTFLHCPAPCYNTTGTTHLAPALMTLDTNAVLGSAAGSSGSTTRLSTPGCAMLALLLAQFPAAVVAPFWESVGALAAGDVVRAAKDPSGSRMLEAALVAAAAASAEVSVLFCNVLLCCVICTDLVCCWQAGATHVGMWCHQAAWAHRMLPFL